MPGRFCRRALLSPVCHALRRTFFCHARALRVLALVLLSMYLIKMTVCIQIQSIGGWQFYNYDDSDDGYPGVPQTLHLPGKPGSRGRVETNLSIMPHFSIIGPTLSYDILSSKREQDGSVKPLGVDGKCSRHRSTGPRSVRLRCLSLYDLSDK